MMEFFLFNGNDGVGFTWIFCILMIHEKEKSMEKVLEKLVELRVGKIVLRIEEHVS
jgi:hypothetical protein